jgi:hypothetical protein
VRESQCSHTLSTKIPHIHRRPLSGDEVVWGRNGEKERGSKELEEGEVEEEEEEEEVEETEEEEEVEEGEEGGVEEEEFEKKEK